MKQIVDGLLYLHSHGILHRDLTLSNLLLTSQMDVVSSITRLPSLTCVKNALSSPNILNIQIYINY